MAIAVPNSGTWRRPAFNRLRRCIGDPLALALMLTFSLLSHLSATAGEAASMRLVRAEGDILVAVVHGDVSIGGAVDYHNRFAASAALSIQGIAAAGLLRPGYFDGYGVRSPGSAFGRKDNYTREAVDMIADAIISMKARFGYKSVILVGHSGGAAISGALMGLRPGVADTAILVSCPCDTPRWRRHVGARSSSREPDFTNDWSRSLSAIDHVAAIAPGARIVAVTSGDDALTPPALARDYVAAAKRAGVDARFVQSSPAGHFLWNMEYAVINEVRIEVERLRRAN